MKPLKYTVWAECVVCSWYSRWYIYLSTGM